MFVPVWVPAVVLLQPYMWYRRVRIPAVKTHKYKSSYFTCFFFFFFNIWRNTGSHPVMIHTQSHTVKTTNMCNINALCCHVTRRNTIKHGVSNGVAPGNLRLWLCYNAMKSSAWAAQNMQKETEFSEGGSWEYKSMWSKHSAMLRPTGAASSAELFGCALSW